MFSTIPSASAFFETGSLGYSVTRDADRFDGMELRCRRWHVDALRVSHVESSFFDERFPDAEFDCAKGGCWSAFRIPDAPRSISLQRLLASLAPLREIA